MAFSPDGQLLAVGNKNINLGLGDATVELWAVGGTSCMRKLSKHSAWVTCIAFSLEGSILVSGNNRKIVGSHDQDLKLWDVNSGELLRTIDA